MRFKHDCSKLVAPPSQRPTRLSSSRSFTSRAREHAVHDKSGRSRGKWFTRIVTDLFNVASSAFRGFAPASSRSSSDFGRLATRVANGVDFSYPRSRNTIATCLVSASNLVLPGARSHLITRFKNEVSVKVNGTSPCIFHRISRTIHIRTISLHEWSSSPWSRHRERAVEHLVPRAQTVQDC